MAKDGLTTLEITEGISDHANRVALKGVFAAFGDVLACWVPPIDRRAVDNASVRFGTVDSADAAKRACDAGQVFFHGLPLKVKWRVKSAPRVGNSDIGGAVNNRSPSPERNKWTRGRDNRPIRRRSPDAPKERERDRRRKSRSRDRRRSRSRDKKSSRDQDKFNDDQPSLPPPSGNVPQALALQEGAIHVAAPTTGAPRPPDYAALLALGMQAPFLPGGPSGMSSGMAPGMTSSMAPGFPPMQPQSFNQSAYASAAQQQVEQLEQKKLVQEAQQKRAQQLKRGPGVAALVQGALKKATTLAKEKQALKNTADPYGIDEVSGKKERGDEEAVAETQRLRRNKSVEEAVAAEREKQDREERMARAAKERHQQQLEEEAREKARKAEEREKARQLAEEEAASRARQEEETREARVKAGLEAAKKQQASRQRLQDNLYGDMPDPDVFGHETVKEAEDAARADASLGLPTSDKTKVIFLDVDGVLRPARAGGFDVVPAEGTQADTSDFFPEAMKALRHIVERTGAIIVLSSEWRRSEAHRRAVDVRLSQQRLRSCEAATPVDTGKDVPGDPVRSFAERRAREIHSWLREREDKVKGWVVLDDVNLAIADESKKGFQVGKPMGPKFVQTWPLSGLTMGNAKKAVRILNGEMIQKVLVERPKAPPEQRTSF